MQKFQENRRQKKVNKELEDDIRNIKEHLKFEEKNFKIEIGALDKRLD